MLKSCQKIVIAATLMDITVTGFGSSDIYKRLCYFVHSKMSRLIGKLIMLMVDILLLESYTRFSCSLIKWNTQQAKLTYHLIPFPLLLMDKRTGQ